MFDEKTKLVVGIVVRGETDFRTSDSGDCNVYNRMPPDAGRGEDVIKIYLILPYLDAAAGSSQAAPVKTDLGAAADGLDSKVRAVEASLDGRR